MKSIFKVAILIFIPFIIYNCSSETAENDWIRADLGNKVESYSEFTYEAIDYFGLIEKGRPILKPYSSSNFVRKYNKNGKLIEQNEYDVDSTLIYKTTYLYGDSGNIIEEVKYGRGGSLDSKTTYLYDEIGKKIEKNTYYTKSIFYDAHYSRNTYIYDKHGNLIEERKLNPDGSLNKKTTFKYDINRNLIEEKKLDSNGNLTKGSIYNKKTFVYDKNGNLVEEKVYFRNDDYGLSKYGKNGNKIQWEKYTSVGIFESMNVYRFNELDDLIEDNDYDSKKNFISRTNYSYGYDKNGNWTQQIEYKDGIAKFLVERKFKYY